MSGVGAVVGIRGRPVGAVVDGLAHGLAPWGGDGEARWHSPDGDAGLVRVRRDLTPEDSHDRQPVRDPSGRYVIVADCRLDDRAGLAHRLGIDGPARATTPDSALIALAWARWGDDLARHVLGGFSVLVWDTRARSLWLACDTAGECPLHWARTDDAVVVASHVPALAALPGVVTRPDLDGLGRLAAGRGPRRPEGTFVEGIDRVLPAHQATIDGQGAVRFRRYWHPSLTGDGPVPADDAWEQVRATLDAAVGDRLRVTGTIAAHCRGGLDSSAVTATAAGLLAPDGRTVTALTAVPDPAWPRPFVDDRPFVEALGARHANVVLRFVDVGGRTVVDVVDALTAARGAPLVHGSNAVGLDALDREAGEAGATAVLVGRAGAATISYAGPDPVRAALGRGALWSAGREALAIAAHEHRSRALVAARHLVRRDPMARPGRWGQWIDRDARGAAADAGGWVATGVRRLDPTADRRLVDLIASLPPGSLAGGGRSRLAVRDALADRLPAEIRGRRGPGQPAVDAGLHLRAVRPAVADILEDAAGDERYRALVDVHRIRVLLLTWPEPPDWRPRDQHRLRAIEQAVAFAAFLRWADTPTLPVSPRPGDRDTAR